MFSLFSALFHYYNNPRFIVPLFLKLEYISISGILKENMPILLFDILFLKSKHTFSPRLEKWTITIYVRRARETPSGWNTSFSLSLSLSPNDAKNMIEIELFIEYFSYYLYLLDYFSKIIFHTT